MSEKKFNVALIGCGVIADFHLQGVLAQKDCVLYAICDNATDDRVERRRAKYNPLHTATDYRELVNDPNVDIAIVATPDNSHLEITSAFLKAGKQVLLEKPMALTIEECNEMRRVEKETGNRLMVGQVARYNPNFKKAKQLVDSGAIGELVFVESEYAHDYMRSRGYDDWRVTPEREGMIGGGCHAVDFLRWIAGNPTEVTAYSTHKYLTDWPVDDTTIAIYKFPNNVIGKVFCSIGVKRDYTMRTCLYGTEGTIIFESHGTEMKLYQVDKNGKNYTFPKMVPCQPKGHNMTAEIDDFIKAIVAGEPNPISSIEGASTVAVCRATVESAKLGQPVQIVYPEA
ncbi:MAG: Gfo/Idh/MocA family oxidoreductase [Oscillospiraceae bacterium]|nr:Gfo/Idh/MocA family oxidoreductase [Oscillospiraceae bacterium]